MMIIIIIIITTLGRTLIDAISMVTMAQSAVNWRELFIVLRMGFEPLVFGSRVNALPIEPPSHIQNATEPHKNHNEESIKYT